MTIKQGSIFITPFPFAEMDSKKIRPALVVSSTRFNVHSSDVWIVALTTQSKHQDGKIPLSEGDLDQGRLTKRSFIRFTAITRIKGSLLLKKVAQLNTKKMTEVIQGIEKILEPSDD